MATSQDIIFEPAYTPNKNWVKELDPRHMDSTLSAFLAPRNDERVITLCRPFVVLTKNSYSSPVSLPLGLAYLGGVLEKAGYKTKIIDATGEQKPAKVTRSSNNLFNIQGLTSKEILEKIDPKTFIFGISLMFSAEWFAHRPLIEEIKKKYPKIIIVAGGEHASAIPEYILRDCPSIDYVIRGEGEFSMLEFTYNMFSGKSVNNIPGISFIDNENKFGYKPTRLGVAIDALAVFVHKDNPTQGMSLKDIDGIFSSTYKHGGKQVKSWGELSLKGSSRA